MLIIFLSQIPAWHTMKSQELIDFCLENNVNEVINDYSAFQIKYPLSDIDNEAIDYFKKTYTHYLKNQKVAL